MKNYKFINNQWRKRRISCRVEGKMVLFDNDVNECKKVKETENGIFESVKRRELENKWRQNRYDSNLELYISDKDNNLSFGRFYIQEGAQTIIRPILPE